MEKINLREKFSLFNDYWNPRIIGELNGQDVKLVKVRGEFVWHDHKNEDELFLIIKGKLKIEFRDRIVELSEGEMIIIPHGVEHKPFADEEVHMMLFEPKSTINTGEVRNENTRDELEFI